MPDTQTSPATVTVRIPTPLRSYTDGNASVETRGADVRAVLDRLVDAYPDLASNLFTDDGDLRQFVNIYVNDDDIRYRDGVDTSVSDDDEISIVPSIAGG